MSAAKKSFIDLTSQIIIFMLSFISGIVLSRLLGPDGRGVFITALFVNTFLHNLSCLALEITNTYFAGQHPSRLTTIHSWSLVLIAVITVILFAIVLIFENALRMRIFGGIPRLYMWVGVSIVPFTLYYAAWKGIMVGIGDIKRLSIISIIYQFFQAAAIIVLVIILSDPLPWLIWSWAVIQVLLIAFLLMAMYKKTGGQLLGDFDTTILRAMLKYSLTAHAGNFATSLLARLDWIYINNFLGTSGIGIYSQATTFTDKISYIPQAMERGSYSKVCVKDLAREEAQKYIMKVFKNTFYLTLLSIICVYVFGAALIYFVLPKFREAIYPLKILLIGTLFFTLARILVMYFSGHKGKPMVPSIIAWIMLGYNLIANYFIIKHNLLPGAAISMALSSLIIFVIYFCLFTYELPKFKLSDFFIPNSKDVAEYKFIYKKIRERINGYLSR